MDKALFMAAAQFCSVSPNAFHFRVGMMSPTIQDISFLTGLRPHGVKADCFLSQKTPSFTYPESNQLVYSNFMNLFVSTGEVSEEEHIALLLYWLNKCVFVHFI